MRWGLAMITDLTPYRKHVDQFDLTDAQRLDLVNALWMIVDSIFDSQMRINQLVLKGKEPEKSIDSNVPNSKIADMILTNDEDIG